MQVKVLTAEGPTLDYLVSTALGYVLEAPDGLARQLWMVQKSDSLRLHALRHHARWRLEDCRPLQDREGHSGHVPRLHCDHQALPGRSHSAH